jgi:hypothetical protein
MGCSIAKLKNKQITVQDIGRKDKSEQKGKKFIKKGTRQAMYIRINVILRCVLVAVVA